MQYRNLGRTGLRISAVALGTWLNIGQRMSNADGLRLLSTAYDYGINLFDTAENYGWGDAQRGLGVAIGKSRWPRDTYCLCSKAFYGSRPDEILSPTQRGLNKKHLVDACNDALRHLGVDYLDLYLCHSNDPNISVDEIVWSMHTLVLQGKILHWGTSKWSADQIARAYEFAREHHLIGPSIEQHEYNLVTTEAVEGELADLVDCYGIGLVTWSPLKQGILAGRYDDGIVAGSRFSFSDLKTLKDQVAEAQFAHWTEIAKRIADVAAVLDVSRAQLAIAWCLKNNLVNSVLLGCSSVEQLAECLHATEVVARISPDMWLELHKLGEAARACLPPPPKTQGQFRQ